MAKITELESLVDSLPRKERELFQRIFDVSVVEGELKPPHTMYPFIERYFGSVEAVTKQRIVKVINKVTFEGSLFNGLRASRPIEFKEKLRIQAQIIDGSIDDPLRKPKEQTPEDTFGRVEGKYSITASNVAKYDGLHGMVIFKNSNPLSFDREHIIDYLNTGWRWAQAAHASDPDAKYFFFLWNCLRRGGASLLHGHAQVTLSRDRHYAKIEALRQAAVRYRKEYGSDYFSDLYQVHVSLGLALDKDGTRVIAYLAPIKEKEIIVMARDFGLSLQERIYEVLSCLRDKMNVTSFNLALITRPLDGVSGWEDFPAMARVVDRGQPKSLSCDIGTMELYADSVISSDPFEVARLLKESM